ncbi:related to MSS51 protein [Phialocephala subalpina]|uniref:Related to MSS51 protein n=1 Tax=Phialocephala subalpina TaxID=576137 RepID=A0A1L7XM22_9HELO|nr:related to MSS51 protein [Phialocephala subalpina]
MSRLQPRSKSLATSNVSSQSASATKEPISRPETPLTRRSTRPPPSDPLSERATLFLIRRTLCSQIGEKGRSTPQPIDALLPPLTSSNEVDLQLYAYISIIIRDFVQTWYGKITPDQTFVEEIVRIIAHCTRALEQRLRKVNLESLMFDELPELLEAHVQAYRTSHTTLHPPPFEQDPRQIYHSLWPFPPLSPVPRDGDQSAKLQQEHESAYRQLLVQGVLAVLLPTEDLENECLTAIVGQIFSDMIIGGSIGGKISEPWMLWEGITKIAEAIKAQLPKSKAQVRVERSNSDLMGTTPPRLNGANTRVWRIKRSLQRTFWLILQYGFLAFTAVRFFIVTFATASSLPSRIANATKTSSPALSKDEVDAADLSNTETVFSGRQTTSKQPIVKMKIWSCASSLLDLDVRMPWLSATISLLQWVAITGPGEIGNTDGLADK